MVSATAARRLQRRARQPRIGQQRQRALGFACLLAKLGKLGVQLLDRVGHGGEPGFRRQPAPGELGFGGAHPRQALLGRSERGDGGALGGGSRIALGPGGDCLLAGTTGIAGRHRDLFGKLGEAVALAQLFRGRRRTRCRPGETVPPPQMSVAVDEALAGLEKRLQAPAIGLARDPAGPRQPAREGRRGGNLAS